MAFCTSCGSNMDANAHFCPKCGKSVQPAAATPAAAAAPAPSSMPPVQAYVPPPSKSGGSGVLKVVLIVIGVFVLIGVMSVAGLMYTAYRVRRSFHVTQDGNNATVDFGGGFKASANNGGNAAELARKVGVDLYPGASSGGETSEAQFGNMKTATIKLTTNDSVQQVGDFYKSRYANAMVSTRDANEFTLVSTTNDGTITITARNSGGPTSIEIAKVSGIKINAH